jgi:hypothetical protein
MCQVYISATAQAAARIRSSFLCMYLKHIMLNFQSRWHSSPQSQFEVNLLHGSGSCFVCRKRLAAAAVDNLLDLQNDLWHSHIITEIK